jgi:ubiquinone/menaquinone biosynthesis C-methylase UbiE
MNANNTDTSSWALGPNVDNPFARPRGLAGRLAGRFMLWTGVQDDLLDILDIRPADRVVEIGYGPGGMIRLLAARTEADLIQGVDPSHDMCRLATKVNQAAVRSGRVKLGVGTAETTGLPAQSVDHVISVNNVAIWPDLSAGLHELHRVVRPTGTVVICWHGGRAPSRIARTLRLPDDKLDQIEAELSQLFADVTRHKLKSLDAFKARSSR